MTFTHPIIDDDDIFSVEEAWVKFGRENAALYLEAEQEFFRQMENLARTETIPESSAAPFAPQPLREPRNE